MSQEGDKTDTRDFEAEARTSGWVPKEEWTKDPNRWVDAKTFVERGEQFFPFVQSKLKKSLEKIDTLESTVNELREGNKQFREFHEQALAREKREREKVIQELEAERKKAITEGDGEAFDRAEKKLQEVRNQPQPKDSNGPDPETQQWLNENTWYNTDPTLQAVADGFAGLVKRQKPHLSGKAFLDEVTRLTKEEMPHKFQNQRRDTVTTEDHTRKTGSNSKAKTYDNLPADAKAACDKFVKTIPGFTREAYLSEYQWSE
jgi:hypothetical protein